MKKKINVEEEVLKDLDFLICEYIKDTNINQRRISQIRERWIKNWVNVLFKEWEKEQEED